MHYWYCLRTKSSKIFFFSSILNQIKKINFFYRLDRPDNCPDVIYLSLMYPCWDYNPQERPSFVKILEIIDDLIDRFREVVEFNTRYS